MADELNDHQLNVAIAKALGYIMEIVTVKYHGTFWQITFPDIRGKSWVCDKDKSEEYAWGRAFVDEWIPDYANDANRALELVQENEDFGLNRDGKEWEAVIGNPWDNNATTYSYRHVEPAYAISRAWLNMKSAQWQNIIDEPYG
jgi:hypothetical protein